MVSRSSLLALFGAGVSALVFFAGASQGLAAGQTFTPATSWAVSRIEPANGSSPYCTLARRFTGNTVITFARNVSGEGTVAVDFQQPLFDPKETYRIVLQAGQGLQREFLTKPATPNALVLRTGADSEFFGAVGEEKEIGVVMDGNRYAFAMPDFSKGSNQLTNCLGRNIDAPGTIGGVVPDSSTPRAPLSAAEAAESEELRQLRSELNALQQQNAGMVQSLKRDTAAPSPVSQIPLSAAPEDKQLIARLAALENEKNALVDKLQADRQRQQQEAQDEVTLRQALQDQKAMRLMLENERAQRTALERSMSAQAAEAEKRGELRARIAALESSNQELKVLRATLDTERQKRLEAEDQLQQRKVAAATSLEEQERLRTRVAELENENQALQQTAMEFDAARDQIADSETRAQMEKARREAAENALKEVQLTNGSRDADVARMQQQIAQESAQRQDMTQKAMIEQARREAAEQALNEAQMSVAQREAEVKRKETELQSKLAQTQKEMADKLAQAQKDAQAAQVENARLKEMADKLAQLESRNNELMDQLRTTQAKAETVEKTALSSTSSNDADVNARIAEMARRAEADKREMQAMLDSEKQRREKLETIMAKGGSSDERVKEMDAQIVELQKKNFRLEERLKEEQSRVASGGGDKALARQLEVLKADNQMLAEKLAKVGAKGATAERVVYQGDDKLAEALAEAKTSLESAKAERDEYRDLLQRERLAKNDKNKDGKADPGANAQIAALETERVELIRQLEFERARLEQIASGKEAPASSEASKQLQARLAMVETERDRLKKQVEVQQRDIIAARQSGGARGAGASAPDSDVAGLLAENRKLQAELAATARGGKTADTKALETEIAALRAQNGILSEEINKRLAAAPTRAQMDNTVAEANYKVQEAQQDARQARAEQARMQQAAMLAAAQQQQPRVMGNKIPAQNPNIVPASLGGSDVGPTGQDIAGYLKRAGIGMVSGFEKVRKVSNKQFAAFRWDTGTVFGTAEQQVMPANKGFEQAVNAYLEKTRSRCSGTYDQSFDPSRMSATKKTFAVADVACVMPDGTGAGAAMLFFYKDGLFNAVAHEGDISQFEQAMTTRDQLAKLMESAL